MTSLTFWQVMYFLAENKTEIRKMFSPKQHIVLCLSVICTV